MKKFDSKNTFKSVWGLFLPWKYDGKWEFTLLIGGVPLGWIIIAVAVIVKIL